MARGKRTVLTRATLALVLFEIGFEPGMVAEVAELPRSTVTDILQGNGPWCRLAETEVYRDARYNDAAGYAKDNTSPSTSLAPAELTTNPGR